VKETGRLFSPLVILLSAPNIASDSPGRAGCLQRSCARHTRTDPQCRSGERSGQRKGYRLTPVRPARTGRACLRALQSEGYKATRVLMGLAGRDLASPRQELAKPPSSPDIRRARRKEGKASHRAPDDGRGALQQPRTRQLIFHAHHTEDEKAAIDLTSPVGPAVPVARSRAIGHGSRRRTKPSLDCIPHEFLGERLDRMRCYGERCSALLCEVGLFDHLRHLRSQTRRLPCVCPWQ
jgi:hypothetical protein